MFKSLLFIFALLFLGCSVKQNSLSNLTALSWHNKIYEEIQNGDLDKADDYFLSLQTEHPSSQYIKTDMLNLYIAHLKSKDYLLAKFYINEYEKRFATLQEIDWCEYQKIKIDFLKYNHPYTNEALLNSIIQKSNNFLVKYINSPYRYEVYTILAKAKLTKIYFNANIKKLYQRIGKEKAAKELNITIPKNSKPPYIPWYKKIFYW